MRPINEIHGPRLPTTSELMKLFARGTPSNTREKPEVKPIELQGQSNNVTELNKQHDEINVLALEQNGQESDNLRTPFIPTHTTQSPSAPTDPIECVHCGEAVTKPLRRLEFDGDRPRIITSCPFCNSVIQ
jgi:hypothetical protein